MDFQLLLHVRLIAAHFKCCSGCRAIYGAGRRVSRLKPATRNEVESIPAN
jgi:predicted anti-sigma-YlaC factor YlaD